MYKEYFQSKYWEYCAGISIPLVKKAAVSIVITVYLFLTSKISFLRTLHPPLTPVNWVEKAPAPQLPPVAPWPPPGPCSPCSSWWQPPPDWWKPPAPDWNQKTHGDSWRIPVISATCCRTSARYKVMAHKPALDCKTWNWPGQEGGGDALEVQAGRAGSWVFWKATGGRDSPEHDT